MHKQKNRNIIRRIILILCGVFAGVNIYFLNSSKILGNDLPMPFGTGLATVLSESMEPVLSRGDLIIVRKTDEYRAGDIIVYRDRDDLIVHRIIHIDEVAITQGDANDVPDEPIEISAIRGKVVFHIPVAGNIVSLIKTPAAGIILLILAIYMTEKSYQNEEDDEEIRRIKEEIEKLKNQK